MANQPKDFYLPLRNITANFNGSKMTSSPMSNLAFNLSELSTGRNLSRRKLTLTAAESSPNHGGESESENSLSEECDDVLWSLTADCSVLGSGRQLSTSSLGFHEEGDDTFKFGVDNVESKQFLDDACSQDSGLGVEQDRRSLMPNFDDVASISSSSSSPSHLDRLPSLEDVWSSLDSPSFKTPKGMPPKRSRSLLDKHFNEDTCSPLKYSPIKSSSLPRPSFSEVLFASQIPECAEESSETQSPVMNDGFLELFKLDKSVNETNGRWSSLIHAKLLHQPRWSKLDEPDPEEDATEVSKEAVFMFGTEGNTPSGCSAITRRKLQRSMSVDNRPRPSFKRCDPPSENTNPVINKKMRGDDDTLTDKSDDNVFENMIPSSCRLQRRHSETETMIKTAISRMFLEPDLLGDCSKTYCLPTISGRHQDLKSISPETLSQLMSNSFSDVVEEYHILDCRYPYEFEGGHIQNAVNIYTKEEVVNTYIRSPLRVRDPNKRMILIFHCEFSSERGPGMCRFLRRQDRETNKECYPFLHYPEMYLLEGGYKQFFEHYSHMCEPRKYKTMLDKNHSEDLRKCRAKCKSWWDDRSHFRTGVRNLRF